MNIKPTSSNKIAYVGAGRLARQFASFREEIHGKPNHSIFFGNPDEAELGMEVRPFESYLGEEYAGYDFYVALGYLQLPLKLRVLNLLNRASRQMPALIHTSAYVHPSTAVGPGVVIYPGTVIGPNCHVRPGALLNTSVTLAHDVVVGTGTYLSPSVTLSGFAAVGDEGFLGTGTLVANDVKIGHRCRLGIGSVVTRSLADGTQGLGNPFKEKTFKII